MGRTRVVSSAFSRNSWLLTVVVITLGTVGPLVAQTPNSPTLSGPASSLTDETSGSPDRSSSTPTSGSPLIRTAPRPSKRDVNADFYYKHKVELSLDGGYLRENVPFMFDFLVGDDYITEFMQYTMVPVFVSLDWQMSKVSGPLFLRGAWEGTVGGAAASVARGPESKFFGYTMGLRRTFIQRRWRVVPYLDGRVGTGHIDSRGPQGVLGAQGQDLVFSLNISSGVRYPITRRFTLSAGVGYMHISNLYLSLPRYANNGINVVGGMVGVHMQLPSRKRGASIGEIPAAN